MYGAELFSERAMFFMSLRTTVHRPVNACACYAQLGPGKSDDGFDHGRQLETGDESDAFAFRTPHCAM